MPTEEVKHGRAGKPKARTGCKTCKKRRVKCDETKPSCYRCTKFGVDCDGYDVKVLPPQRRPKPRPSSNYDRILLPKGQFSDEGLHLKPNPALMPDMQDDDYLYFQYFRELSFHEFGDGPWMQIMIQASYNQPTIQYLISSVAALCRAKYGITSNKFSSQHLQHAYQRYGQAVQGIRRLISISGLDSAKTLLQGSLLIFVFEMLQGNVLTACSHLHNSFKSLVLQQLPESGLLSYTHVRPADQYACMDPELMASYARLDVQLCSHPLNPFPAKSTLFGISYQTEPYTIPTTFKTLDTARLYLEDIIQRVRAGVSEYAARDAQNEDRLSDAEAALIQSQVQDWQSALLPFYQRSLTPAGSHEMVRASILYVQATGTSFILQRFRSRLKPNIDLLDQSSIDQERKLCLKVVEMCKKAARHKDFMTFVVHEGFLRSLFLIGTLTADEDIRLEVLAALEEMGERREGVWDAAVVAQAVKASTSRSNWQNVMREKRHNMEKCENAAVFHAIFDDAATLHGTFGSVSGQGDKSPASATQLDISRI